MTSPAFKQNYMHINWAERLDECPKKVQDFSELRSDLQMPMIIGDYKPYECPITGRTIEGRSEHRENLKRHGCRILEKGEFEDVKKNGKKRREEAIEAAVDRAVEKVAKDFI